MSFTTSEKLQIAMLCDLAKPEGQRELDFEFINRVIIDDHIWALSWKYPGLHLKVETSADVKLVIDIIEMWDHIESSFAALSKADKKRVEVDSYYNHEPKFPGFDGNCETELVGIARLLMHDLGRWERFKKRELISNWPSVDIYDRELAAWQPMRKAKTQNLGGPSELAADELIAILRERIHPENRKPTTGGNWVLDESKK
jgi:uncharacterized protein